jgi:sulfur carrier protein ThiS
MRILYVNNDGGGFADYIEVEPTTTVKQLFADRMSGRHAEDFLIRVNRLPVAADHVLQEGDRITITPTKVEGARHRCCAP